MRCSSSESRLDEFVDGTLSERDHARVAAHVEACARCAELLAEVRAIDGLLLSPRSLEPRANFTFAVMADVRTLAPPRAHRFSSLRMLGAYVAFAWLTIAGFFLAGGSAMRATLHAAQASFAGAGSAIAPLAAATTHVLGGNPYGATAAMGALLAVDVVFGAGVFATYLMLRSRRVALERGGES